MIFGASFDRLAHGALRDWHRAFGSHDEAIIGRHSSGAWAYAPDPVDFHDFTGPDLTATPPGNFYRRTPQDEYSLKPNGTLTLRQMAQGDAGVIWVEHERHVIDEIFRTVAG